MFPFINDNEKDYVNNLLHVPEERHSLLGDEGSCSDLSANLCEIEDSEAEEPPAVPPPPARHTDV